MLAGARDGGAVGRRRSGRRCRERGDAGRRLRRLPRRKAFLVRRSCNDARSGVISTPEGPSRAESRREPVLRRQFLAGVHALAASVHETFLPAPISRRKVHLRSWGERNPTSGELLTPEGLFSTLHPRQRILRRHASPSGIRHAPPLSGDTVEACTLSPAAGDPSRDS